MPLVPQAHALVLPAPQSDWGQPVVGQQGSVLPPQATQLPSMQPLFALQLVPQPPQFELSVEKFVQSVGVPLAGHGFGAAAVQAQLPVEQAAPATQALVQLPQCWSSVCSSTHAPEHRLPPFASHASVQVPVAQLCPVPQAWPQVAQLLGSVWRSVQALPPPQWPLPQVELPLQSVCPEAQVQVPLEQVAPGSQTFPQPPQLEVSVFLSTQRVPQTALPLPAQFAWQPPPVQ